MTRFRKTPGRVVFVGAGPGDPGMLTARATAALAEASVVLVDPDVPAALTDAVRDGRPGLEPTPVSGEPADVATRACVLAERTTLTALEAGCSAPVAAYAELAEGEDGPELYLRASVTAIDGSDGVRDSVTGPVADAERLGRALAAELLDRGAAELMAASR